MAATALAAYRGNCVAVVGEWLGDTATPAFEEELHRAWQLQDRIALPNWSDTAHDLTIWRRRTDANASADNGGSSAAAPSVASEPAEVSSSPAKKAAVVPQWPVCSASGAHPRLPVDASARYACVSVERSQSAHAGATLGDVLQRGAPGLRRCRYARDVLLSGEEAWRGFEAEARQRLALRFVFFQRPLQLKSDLDFETVGSLWSDL